MVPIKTEKFKLFRKSPFGEFALLWSLFNNEPKIFRILLPGLALQNEKSKLEVAIEYSVPAMNEIAARIGAFMEGEKKSFNLDSIRLDLCSEFQQWVLRAEHRIPYGCVSTYKRIAIHLGQPTASRAVGNALANNPFPIIIPCHRAVRANFSVGGFQGGEPMKRALLEFEGNQFDKGGKIICPEIFY